MSVRRVILLLLSWRLSLRCSASEELQLVFLDPAASKSIASILGKSKAPTHDRSKIDTLETTTIHYENSNGFVPMVSRAWHRKFHDKENEKGNVTSGNTKIPLARSSVNRRSFEELEDQGLNDFELLKVNSDIPKVADYQQFYNGIRNEDDPEGMKNRSHDLNKIVEFQGRNGYGKVANLPLSYGTKMKKGGNEEGTSDRHYWKNRPKEDRFGVSSYASGKVPGDFHGRDFRRESGARQRLPTLRKINYDTVESPRNNFRLYNDRARASTVKNRHRNSESAASSVSSVDSRYDGRLGSHFGGDEMSYESSRDSADSSIEDQSDRLTLDHEALFNRDEGDRTEEEEEEEEEDSNEYPETLKRPWKIHSDNGRPVRPNVSEGYSEKHREDSGPGGKRKRQRGSRSRSHRHRLKSNSWIEENRMPIRHESSAGRNYDGTIAEDDVSSEIRDRRIQRGSSKPKNSWTRVSPDIEVSHSRGIEIDQRERPKLVVPIKLNLVPVVANFDHATALENSQGFDVSNVVWGSIVTPAPILGNPEYVRNTVIDSKPIVRNTPRNTENVGTATTVPDIIIGQNVVLSPHQTALVPKQNLPEQGKLAQNLITRHVQSTVNPVPAVNENPNTNLQATVQQGASNQNYQSHFVAPRPTYVSTPGSTSNLLQSPSVNQVQDVPGRPQFLVQHSTPRILSGLDQSAVQPNLNGNVQVTLNGLDGQNLIPDYNHPAATLTSHPTSTSSVNLLAAESQNKGSNVVGSDGQFFATASLSVGDSFQRDDSANDNDNFYVHGQNGQQVVRPRLHKNFYRAFKNDNLTPQTKIQVQSAETSPTIFSPETSINGVNFNDPELPVALRQTFQINAASQRHKEQSQQILKAANDIFENTVKHVKQLQQSQTTRTNRPVDQNLQFSDSAKSNSNVNFTIYAPPPLNVDKARTASVIRTKNVELLNSSIKPSPIDWTPLNSLGNLNNYLTSDTLFTPIPILSTANHGVIPGPAISTTEAINFRNLVDPLTQSGTNTNGVKLNLKLPLQSLGLTSSTFNPINLVPSTDLAKTQAILNSRLNLNEPQLPNLNHVLRVPQDNYYKTSYAIQNDPVAKPKSISDLEKYAEEMFKESLKAIYNSQGWNNDRTTLQGPNSTKSTDLSKLKNELRHLRTSFPEMKPSKEILEAHYTENNIRTAEPAVQLSWSNVDAKKPKLHTSSVDHVLKLEENHDKANIWPAKPPPASNLSNQSGFKLVSDADYENVKDPYDFLTPPKPDSFALNAPFFEQSVKKWPAYFARYNFENTNSKTLPRSSTQTYDNYPTFTTSIPENNRSKPHPDHENSKKMYYDVNHPRIHNLLALLRKNKRLPNGRPPNYFRNEEELKQHFENEKRQLEHKFYDNNLTNFRQKFDKLEPKRNLKNPTYALTINPN